MADPMSEYEFEKLAAQKRRIEAANVTRLQQTHRDLLFALKDAASRLRGRVEFENAVVEYDKIIEAADKLSGPN